MHEGTEEKAMQLNMEQKKLIQSMVMGQDIYQMWRPIERGCISLQKTL